MRTRRSARWTVAIGAVLLTVAVPGASAADQPWVFSGGVFNVENGSKISFDISNFSATTASFTALLSSEVPNATKSATIGPSGESGLVSGACPSSACAVQLYVSSTTPDVFLTAVVTLDGNTQQTLIGPSGWTVVGPHGALPSQVAALAASTSSALTTIQGTLGAIQTALSGVGGQVGAAQGAIGAAGAQLTTIVGAVGSAATSAATSSLGSQVHTLTKRVDTLTHDLKKLSDALLPKKKPKSTAKKKAKH